MKKLAVFLVLLLLFSAGCAAPEIPEESVAPVATVPTTTPTLPPPTEAEIETTQASPVIMLSEDEQTMLLKLGMAERGNTGCTECVALVMCTVLNRVNADRFGSSIRSVIFAQEQFTPVMDGSYDHAEPNELCYNALEMVIHGWDESQGALYYEWCKGESWHSKNLHLLMQHCDTRFYE